MGANALHTVGEAFFEEGTTLFGNAVSRGHGVGAWIADDDDLFLAAGDGGVDEVSL